MNTIKSYASPSLPTAYLNNKIKKEKTENSNNG